jgi:hypothetical protein
MITTVNTLPLAQPAPSVAFGAGPDPQWLQHALGAAKTALDNTTDMVLGGAKTAWSNTSNTAKVLAPFTALYTFTKRDELTNGLDRLFKRKKFAIRTKNVLKDPNATFDQKVKALHWRSRWGLDPLPSIPKSLQEMESESRTKQAKTPVVPYQPYMPTLTSVLAQQELPELQLPVPYGMPINIKPWRNPGTKKLQLKPGANFNGNPTRRLSHRFADIQGAQLPGVNFSYTDLDNTWPAATQSFGMMTCTMWC